MKKKKKSGSPAKYFIGLIALFLVMAGGLTLVKAGGGSASLANADSSKTLAAVGATQPVFKNVTIDGVTSTGNWVPGAYQTVRWDGSAFTASLAVGVHICHASGSPCWGLRNSAGKETFLNDGNESVQIPSSAQISGILPTKPYYARVLARINPNTDVLTAGKSAQFFVSDLSLTSVSVNVTPINNGANPVVSYTASYTFTLRNLGTNNLYLSTNPGIMVSTTTSPGNNVLTSLSSVLPMAARAGDTATAYVIPAGSVRTITLNGRISKYSDTSLTTTLTIAKINYGTSAINPKGKNQDVSQSGLSRTITFDGGVVSPVLSISNASVGNLTPINNGVNPIVRYTAAYTFTLVNSGNNTLFVSNNPGTMVSTVTSPINNASSSIAFMNSPTAISGDTATAYALPAGMARTFSLQGIISRYSNNTNYSSLAITKINYGPFASNPTSQSITSGLNALTATVVF